MLRLLSRGPYVRGHDDVNVRANQAFGCVLSLGSQSVRLRT